MVWQQGFYVPHPVQGTWQLRLEFQSHEPTNGVFLNGHFLGYLPAKDWTYSWVSTTLPVPGRFLQGGYNELAVRAGHVAPELQGAGFIWDEVLLRDIFLDPPASNASIVE